MDSRFRFLTTPQIALISDVLNRRNPALLTRINAEPAISRSDAEALIVGLSDELADSLDESWEPTEYGRSVSAVLDKVNAVRIAECQVDK